MTNHAKLNFDENGTPVSTEFDDIYFSKHDGLAETEYVFLKNNNLEQQLLEFDSHSNDTFHIAETGFGTGLNFLATCRLLAKVNHVRAQSIPTKPPVKLTFTSFEKFPLTKQDLNIALAHWPSLTEHVEALLTAYPPNFDTFFTSNHNIDHQANICSLQLNEGQIDLNLVLGDVNQQMPKLINGFPKVDAWYLDGFAPSKNPEMWTTELFSNIASMSKPGATLATFTAAGLVRRGLIEVGFEVNKVKGFGRKREMLAASFQG